MASCCCQALRSFEKNRIAIDVNDLPLEATAAESQAIVVPRDGAGVVVDFGVKADAKGVIVQLVDAAGLPLQEGIEVFLEGSEEPFFMGYDGEVYLTGMKPKIPSSLSILVRNARLRFGLAPEPRPAGDNRSARHAPEIAFCYHLLLPICAVHPARAQVCNFSMTNIDFGNVSPDRRNLSTDNRNLDRQLCWHGRTSKFASAPISIRAAAAPMQSGDPRYHDTGSRKARLQSFQEQRRRAGLGIRYTWAPSARPPAITVQLAANGSGTVATHCLRPHLQWPVGHRNRHIFVFLFGKPVASRLWIYGEFLLFVHVILARPERAICRAHHQQLKLHGRHHGAELRHPAGPFRKP